MRALRPTHCGQFYPGDVAYVLGDGFAVVVVGLGQLGAQYGSGQAFAAVAYTQRGFVVGASFCVGLF